VGQFDIRTLCVNHWGSDQGITVLKQLSHFSEPPRSAPGMDVSHPEQKKRAIGS